jgi:16S rRNA (cytidine1402-2'-O)-methyltransferase
MTYQESLTTMTQADLSPNRSKLYVVATPIGNLGDLSPRAREVIARVDLVCAEDTRVFRHLCAAAGLSTSRRVVSLHAHNEAEKIANVLNLLKQNQSVALVSDAGTPGLSDPGQRLVFELARQGIEVVAVPGPSALTAALSIGGLRPEDGEPIMFWGFLPARTRQRQDQLARLSQLAGLHVFFESPHRILECLEDALNTFDPNAEAVIARELTKRFETCLRGGLAELLSTLKDQAQTAGPQVFKGEFVVLIKNRAQATSRVKTASAIEPKDLETHDLLWLKSLCSHCPKPIAAKVVAEALGMSRDDAYRLVLDADN